MKQLTTLLIVAGLALATSCVSTDGTLGYRKSAGGQSSAPYAKWKNVTVSGDVIFEGVRQRGSDVEQAGGLSPADSLNGNAVGNGPK